MMGSWTRPFISSVIRHTLLLLKLSRSVTCDGTGYANSCADTIDGHFHTIVYRLARVQRRTGIHTKCLEKTSHTKRVRFHYFWLASFRIIEIEIDDITHRNAAAIHRPVVSIEGTVANDGSKTRLRTKDLSDESLLYRCGDLNASGRPQNFSNFGSGHVWQCSLSHCMTCCHVISFNAKKCDFNEVDRLAPRPYCYVHGQRRPYHLPRHPLPCPCVSTLHR